MVLAKEFFLNEKNPNLLLWLVAVGFFMETLDSTIVNTALPTMARDLGESPLEMYSVVIAYSLTIALLIPASGWLADRFGIKRMFQTAICLFTLGSALCALSQSLHQLVLSRVLQGCGGAMLLPIGRLAVLRVFPREKFLEAISFVAIPGLIGPLLGPTLGGFLAEAFTWHWIFLINLPIGLLGLIFTHRYMPAISSPEPWRFDIEGYVMLAMSMVTLSLGLEGLAGLGFQHATVLILFVFGVAGLLSYGLHASKVLHPLFDLALFRNRTFTIGLAGNLFARVGSSGMPFLVPLLLQVCLGYSPLQAGLTMIPIAGAALVAKRIAARVIRRLGYRRFLVGNTFAVGLAIASFALITREQWYWVRFVQLALFGMVNSLQFTAMNSLTLKDLDERGASSGNSLFSMVQMLALSFGVAAAGALLTTFTGKFGEEHILRAFHYTFLCVGVMTCASAWIFWQLGEGVAPRREEKTQLEMHS